MCFLSLAQTDISLGSIIESKRDTPKTRKARKEKHENNESTTQEDLLSNLAFLI